MTEKHESEGKCLAVIYNGEEESLLEDTSILDGASTHAIQIGDVRAVVAKGSKEELDVIAKRQGDQIIVYVDLEKKTTLKTSCYTIASGETKQELARKVRDLEDSGFILVGGISSTVYFDSRPYGKKAVYEYTQAVSRAEADV